MVTQTVSTNSRLNSSDLMGKITQHIEELAQATDAARLSEEMLAYLNTCAKFHHYSPYNIWNILFFNPGATQVAGFHKWKSFKRYVKKGEKGIPILAPVMIKQDKDNPDSDETLVGFKIVYVFDVSQTEGDPLPPVPDWKSPEKNQELEDKLIRFANSHGIFVSYKKQKGEIQGVSKGGSIEIDPSAGTKTLIHEIAHELMHRNENFPTDSAIRELEAESVAYVVAKYFGLSQLNSPNYIALHGASKDVILGHIERIRRTVLEMLNHLN